MTSSAVNLDYSNIKPDVVATPRSITFSIVARLYSDAHSTLSPDSKPAVYNFPNSETALMLFCKGAHVYLVNHLANVFLKK